MTRDELLAKLRRTMANAVPGPPQQGCKVRVSNPAHYDVTLDETGARALLEHAVPEGWAYAGADRLRRANGDGWEYHVHLTRQATEPPFTAGRVLAEYEALDGDWQAVAIVLDVPYREFARWMTTDDMADLAELWGEEQTRLRALREYGAERAILRGPYTRRHADLTELQQLGRDYLALAPLAEQMVEQINEGRSWAPVAVLRHYCDTGHPGLLEHLIRLGWVAA